MENGLHKTMGGVRASGPNFENSIDNLQSSAMKCNKGFICFEGFRVASYWRCMFVVFYVAADLFGRR